jgi:hypothetical protein
VKVEISKRARRELERAAKWWENPNILWDELEEAGRRLLQEPEAGVRWVSSKGHVMWRLRLPRSEKFPTALARALMLAAEAQRWEVVAQIATELAERRKGRELSLGPAGVMRTEIPNGARSRAWRS